MSDTEIEKLKKIIEKQQHEIEIISNTQKQKSMLLRQIRIVNNLTEENDKLKTENEKLNKKIRRYEEMLGSMFAAGNMIMQEKSKYEELRRL